MKRPFKYTVPHLEGTTVEAVRGAIDTILSQHEEFIESGFKDHISPEDFNSRFEEETKKRSEVQAELQKKQGLALEKAKKLVSEEKTQMLLDLAHLTDEELNDEAKRVEKLEATFEKYKDQLVSEAPGIQNKIIVQEEQPQPEEKPRMFAPEID